MYDIEKSRMVEIIRLHNEINHLLVTGLQKAMQIGKLLIEVKKGKPHGEFGTWIDAHMPFSHVTASKRMKLYRKRKLFTSTPGLLLTEAYEILRPAKPVASHVLRQQTVSIRDIDPNPYFDMGYLHPEVVAWKIKSFEHIGPHFILAVRSVGDRYQNICDHDHYFAMQKLGVTKVSVSVVSLDDDHMKSTVEQFDHHPLSAWLHDFLTRPDDDDQEDTDER